MNYLCQSALLEHVARHSQGDPRHPRPVQVGGPGGPAPRPQAGHRPAVARPQAEPAEEGGAARHHRPAPATRRHRQLRAPGPGDVVLLQPEGEDVHLCAVCVDSV